MRTWLKQIDILSSQSLLFNEGCWEQRPRVVNIIKAKLGGDKLYGCSQAEVLILQIVQTGENG